MLKEESVGIAYYQSAPESAISAFVDSLAQDGIEVQAEPLGPPGVYASVEWLIPTLVAVVLAPVSAGFFQAAGEDAYCALKVAVAQLAAGVFGRAKVIRSGEIHPQPSEFSLALSIVVPLPEDWHLKILLRESYDASRLDAVLDRLYEQLDRLERGEVTQLFDTAAIPAYMGRMILARYDETQDALLVVDPVAEAIRRKS